MKRRIYSQEEEADARQRRREELVKLGHLKLEELPQPSIVDPPQYLESLRLPLIQRLKQVLEDTEDEELCARICVNLLKFSSMGRSSVDLIHSLKRDELPDLSRLFSEAELEGLLEAPPGVLDRLAHRLSLDQDATATTSGSSGLDNLGQDGK